MKSSPSIWHLLHNVKSTVKISSIFGAFLENTNFNFKCTFERVETIVFDLEEKKVKVQTFWEAHIIWKNLPHGFDVYWVCFSESPNFTERSCEC